MIITVPVSSRRDPSSGHDGMSVLVQPWESNRGGSYQTLFLRDAKNADRTTVVSDAHTPGHTPIVSSMCTGSTGVGHSVTSLLEHGRFLPSSRLPTPDLRWASIVLFFSFVYDTKSFRILPSKPPTDKEGKPPRIILFCVLGFVSPMKRTTSTLASAALVWTVANVGPSSHNLWVGAQSTTTNCPATTLAFQDEFNGSTLDTSLWTPQIGNGCDQGPNLCGW